MADNRELKHRRRNPRTTTTGSLISRFVCTTHVRVCEWVIHVSTTTAFCMEFRSPENVSRRGVPEALFTSSLFLFAKLYAWMSERMWLHHTELCFLLLLQDNIASVYIANIGLWPPLFLRGKLRKRKLWMAIHSCYRLIIVIALKLPNEFLRQEGLSCYL